MYILCIDTSFHVHIHSMFHVHIILCILYDLNRLPPARNVDASEKDDETAGDARHDLSREKIQN